jgi:serine/threonine-protein phosphatase 2B regulatory subunit
MVNPEQHFKPGRLAITCLNAECIRGRANSNDDILTPHLLFNLPTNGIASLPLKQSRIGTRKGHNVTFDNEVVCFDIANPELLLIDDDISIIVQLRDGIKGLIAQCKASIIDVLLTSDEITKSLSVLNPSDTTSNSAVNLTFAFVKAYPGMLKVDLGTFKNCIDNNIKRYVVLSTADGQSKTSSLADSSNLEGGFSFWVDERNWFGEIDVEIHEEGGDMIIGEGRLNILNCLKGDDVMTNSLISMTWDRGLNQLTPSISVRHLFLVAGSVRVQCISANGVRAVANPRVVFKAAGRTYMTEKPTLIKSASLLWNKLLLIPVVSEASFNIEYGDFDQLSGQFESYGFSVLNLLSLYESASIDESVYLKQQNELGEISIDGGRISMTLQFVFQGQSNIAFPRDQETVKSYIPRDTDTFTASTKNDGQGFSEADIRQAFNKIDLDKNGYIGAAELRHCLMCMGEHVTEAEIDMMISMLGDAGQVSFKSFRAMVESPEPAKDDFSSLYVPTRAGNQDNIMQDMFIQHMQTHNITKADVLRAWDSLRRSALSSMRGSIMKFRRGYDQLAEIMPHFGDFSRVFHLLCHNAGNEIDGRELLMCFATIISFSVEDKCKLAFDMFDVDESGYFSVDQIEVLLTCTHFSRRKSLKKKAYNLLRLVGVTNTGGVSMKALAVGANKFPSLVFPPIQQQEASTLVFPPIQQQEASTSSG